MRGPSRIIEAGQKHRVNIACVHGVSLDLGDPTGVAVAQILTAIAAMETAHKGDRQKAANKQRAAAGEGFWRRRPFGYDRTPDGHVFTVEPEAEAIRDAAKAVLGAATLSSVARQWNAEGFTTTTKEQGKWRCNSGPPAPHRSGHPPSREVHGQIRTRQRVGIRYLVNRIGRFGGFVDWFFDGLGTMLIGLVIGGATGTAGGWTIAKNKFTRQSQKAGNNSRQSQIGGNNYGQK